MLSTMRLWHNNRLLGSIWGLVNDCTWWCLDVITHEVCVPWFSGEHVHELIHKFAQLLVLCGHQFLS